MGDEEISPWLKSLPVAPEYHPTEAEFADPIGYILKIEKEATQYGICKIIPPFPKASRKLVISNLNRSLTESQDSAVAGVHGSSVSSLTVSRNMNTTASTCSAPQQGSDYKSETFEAATAVDGDCKARFTTRHQQIGWSPRKLRGPMQSVVQKPVWESGESYTIDQFEAKARAFHRLRLGTGKEISPLAIETMFWKAALDRPISVEYANDIPGSAFGEPSESFTCQSTSQLRKRKMELQSQVAFENQKKIETDYSMQELGPKDNSHVNSAKAFALSEDTTEDNHVSSTKSAEDTNITESPITGKLTTDEMSDHMEDGVKKRNKTLDGNVDREVGGAGWKLSNSAWNMRIVARSPGSLIRHMPDEVPGVTTPMVYIGMLFSWFAWHVEDHELHSLNYLQTGSPKTWYAVPGDAAASLEDVIRVHGYGEHLSPLAAFAILGEKTTLMSPEILIQTGVPCCRLVQYPGEFVVTFPRAYHLGFSHGFNCGEAANIATPAWLKVAKEAAVRRAAMNYLPMMSHQQLLYMHSLSFPQCIPMSLAAEPRSSRLKDKKKSEGEIAVKSFFVNDMIHNNHLLDVLLEKESTCYAVLWDSADVPSGSPSSCVSSISYPNWRSTFGTSNLETLQSDSAIANTLVCKEEQLCAEGILEMNKKLSDSIRMKSSTEKCQQENPYNYSDDRHMEIHSEEISIGSDSSPGDLMHLDTGTLACAACGLLGFPCMAIIQPSEAAARKLFPSGYKEVDRHFGASEVCNVGKDVSAAEAEVIAMQRTCIVDNCAVDFLLETPIALLSNGVDHQDQVGEGLCVQPSEVNTVGNCTASLVHTNILEPSVKDRKIHFSKRKIEHPEFISAVTPMVEVTDTDDVLAEQRKPTSDLNNLLSLARLIETSAIDVCDEKSPDGSKTILQNTAETFVPSDSSSNMIFDKGESNCQDRPSPFCSSKMFSSNNTASSGINNQNIDFDASNKAISKSVSNMLPVSSPIPVPSALDLLAATYNDASDSDEMDDAIEVNGAYPFCGRSEIISDNNDIAGAANTLLSSFGSTRQLIREQAHDDLIVSVPLPSDKVSLVSKELNYSSNDSLKQDNSFKKEHIESLDHSAKRSSQISQHLTNICGDIQVNGSKLSSIESDDLQQQSIVTLAFFKTSVKDTSVYEAQQSDQSTNKKDKIEGICAQASKCAEGLSNVILSSVPETETVTENVTVSTVSTSLSVSDTDIVSECIMKSKGFNSGFEATCGDFCIRNDSLKESLSEGCAGGNLGGCDTGYASQENIPDTAAFNGRTASLWKPGNGVMRPHVFCLEHALQVEEELHSMGGVHLLLLCHANYPKIEEKAKLIAKEIGVDNSWKSIPLRNAGEDDLQMIAVAIEEEIDTELGRDWTAQLGVNLRYSVQLSKSPLHSKQMTHGRVLDKLFCNNGFDVPDSPSHKWRFGESHSLHSPRGTEDCKQKVSRHKKLTVAGRWCGKVWMAKQVHPYLGRHNLQEETGFVSNQIGCTKVDRSCRHSRKRTSLILDNKIMFEEDMKETCNENICIPYTSDLQNQPINEGLCGKRKLDMEERTCEGKRDVQVFKDRILDSSDLSKSGNPSLKQIKSDDLLSEQADSCKLYEQLSTEAESLLSQGRPCHNTSAGKSRQKRKKQTGWTRGGDSIEVFANPAENSEDRNKMMVSEEYASPGPRTRLRTRTLQSKAPTVATHADKVSGKQCRSSSRKVSTRKKITKSTIYKDDEDEGSYHCDIEGCNMTFQTKQELLVHKRNACTVKGCGKRFGSHKYLLQHRRVHLDDRPLKCTWKGCEMTFKWPWARTEHIRVHTGERPYVCPVASCGKTFRFVSDFSRHKRKTGHK